MTNSEDFGIESKLTAIDHVTCVLPREFSVLPRRALEDLLVLYNLFSWFEHDKHQHFTSFETVQISYIV